MLELTSQDCRNNILSVEKAVKAGLEDKSRTTIIHQLLARTRSEGHSAALVESLTDDTLTFILAASDTTGNAMTTAMYEVVSNPAIYSKLAAELNSAFPDSEATLDFIKLEKLQYLVCASPLSLVKTDIRRRPL